MTDREMMEMAARAAGIPHGADRIDCGLSLTNEDGKHTSLPQWNPLDDDGDALRLAGDLSFVVNIWNSARKTFAGYAESGEGWTEYHGSDPYAATRRAIVCAAAEIGRQMEETK